MASRTNRATLRILAVAGAAAALAWPAATPAGAAEYPGWGISLYSGADLTGTRTVVDLDDSGCHTLSEAALSAVDVSDADLYAYYNTDCRTGLPGQSGDSYFIVGSLHTAQFPLPVLSYRVVRNG